MKVPVSCSHLVPDMAEDLEFPELCVAAATVGTCLRVAAAREALEFSSSSGDISFLSSGHFQGCDPEVLPGASTESAPHGLSLTS